MKNKYFQKKLFLPHAFNRHGVMIVNYFFLQFNINTYDKFCEVNSFICIID